jgi:ribosomal protein S18 acetylase RimI-like enzyme
VTKEPIHSLQFHHDRFARNVSTSLSAYLRTATEAAGAGRTRGRTASKTPRAAGRGSLDMRLDDWRTASPDEMARCYAAECARWRSTLHWDTARTWQTVEAERVAGTLPGFVLRDEAGAIRAWSFHLLHRGELQLGTLVAYSQRATESLVKAMSESPEARLSTRWTAFGWFEAPGLVNVLRTYGVRSERYRYLYRDLPRPTGARQQPVRLRAQRSGAAVDASTFPRPWQREDDLRLAPLLSSAYYDADPVRPFAANGTMDEWVEYAANLMDGSGCGTFDPGISCASMRGNELDGAAVMTRLLPTTAHLAQLAVRGNTQGGGLGKRLLTAAVEAAAVSGYECVTLLVRESNAAAISLYARLGFVERARFLSASSAISARLSAVS